MPKQTKKTNALMGGLWPLPVLVTLIAFAGCGETEPDPPRAAAIAISPASATLVTIGETATFTATVTDQYGDAFNATVTWSSDAPGVFTVANGVVTAVTNGTGMVTASVGDLSATASVTVSEPLRAAAITISPASATLTKIGETATFMADVTDQFGDAYVATVAWSSGAPEVFTVDADGVVTAVYNGTADVVATVEEVADTAAVTVDAGQPPRVRSGVRQGLTVPMGAGGGALPWQPAERFADPDDDVLDLTYTVQLGDSSVAEASVMVDDEGIPWVIMAGTAAGSTDLTVTATDPAGLSADVGIVLAIDDSGLTPLSGMRVGNNRLRVSSLALLGGCTPPLVNTLHTTGAIVTINSSKWQTRGDSEAAWSDVDGTEVMNGQICTLSTRTPGEYRLATVVTTTLGQGIDPLSGPYTAGNTFVVEDNPGGTNRAPELSEFAPPGIPLSVGGGPNLMVPAAYLSDPDFDELTFSVSTPDSSLVSAEIVTDGVEHRVVVLTGLAVGIARLTVTATDPDGLSADMPLTIKVDDSGNTPYNTIAVGNGVIRLLGFGGTACTPPFVNLVGIDSWVYTVHSSHWQTRSDSTEAWTAIEGTEKTNGQLCPYETDSAGDYRLVYEATIVVSQDVTPFRGQYASFNFFTVEEGN